MLGRTRRSSRTSHSKKHKCSAATAISSLQQPPQQPTESFLFYWNRPLGAPDGVIRLVVVVVDCAHDGRQRRRAPIGDPQWGLPYCSADALVKEAISASSFSNHHHHQKCHDLEVIVRMMDPRQGETDETDQKTDDDDLLSLGWWTDICQAVARYHGRTLRSLRLQGLTQGQELILFRSLLLGGSISCRLQHVSWILSASSGSSCSSSSFPVAALQFLCQPASSRAVKHSKSASATATAGAVVVGSCLQDVRILMVPSSSSSLSSSLEDESTRHAAPVLLQALQTLPALRVLVCQVPLVNNHCHNSSYSDMVRQVETSIQLERVELHFVSATTTAAREKDSVMPVEEVHAQHADAAIPNPTLARRQQQQEQAVTMMTTTRRGRGGVDCRNTVVETTRRRHHHPDNNHQAEENQDDTVVNNNHHRILPPLLPLPSSFNNHFTTCADDHRVIRSSPGVVVKMSPQRQAALDWKLQCNYFRRCCLESWAMRQRRSLVSSSTMTTGSNSNSSSLLLRRLEPNHHLHDESDDNNDVARIMALMDASLRILEQWQRTTTATTTTTKPTSTTARQVAVNDDDS